MTDPPMTSDEADTIARLCGGVPCNPTCGGWRFGPLHVRHWLMPRHPEAEANTPESMQESILLRGLARAGVLDGLRFNGDDFVATAGKMHYARLLDAHTVNSWSGPTPLAALIALALAHVRCAR